jgi:hypothetical protein
MQLIVNWVNRVGNDLAMVLRCQCCVQPCFTPKTQRPSFGEMKTQKRSTLDGMTRPELGRVLRTVNDGHGDRVLRHKKRKHDK